MTIPPYLKSGSRIGITCPAGAVLNSEIENMFTQLRAWEFALQIGKTIGTSYLKFSANDETRLHDLQSMLDDENLDAILFGRGGYGVVRIIDQLDFTKFLKKPKWILGYSDITCLHSHIHSQLQIATIHAHMNGGYQPQNQDAFSTQTIYDVLTGKSIQYDIPSHQMNKSGSTIGMLVGGNLALISDLIGTQTDIDTSGKILFLEDIAEYKYNIDRMMWQLLRSGKLNNLAGLIIGGFSDTQDNEIPFGMTEYEIVAEKLKSFSFPVCFDFPVGHQPRNWALKLGSTYFFSVNDSNVNLYEI
jgi:muramoyltetrapeptide carboxypeptidase